MLIAWLVRCGQGARAVAVRFLHSAGGRGVLARGLCLKRLAGRLATGGLAGGLLRASHVGSVEICPSKFGGSF